MVYVVLLMGKKNVMLGLLGSGSGPLMAVPLVIDTGEIASGYVGRHLVVGLAPRRTKRGSLVVNSEPLIISVFESMVFDSELKWVFTACLQLTVVNIPELSIMIMSLTCGVVQVLCKI